MKLLTLVLYGSKTWSLALREERRLRVFGNRVVRKVFGSKRDEVTGGCRKLRAEEPHSLLSSAFIIRVTKARKMR
jgi:hypothetical protein